MNVFILEDDPERIKRFKQMLIGHNLVITDVAWEANEILSQMLFDFIFLDHDLGGEQMVDTNVENTGSTVAKHIPSTINRNVQVYVHSFNPIGAQNMLDAMRSQGVGCIYIPFITKDFHVAISHVNSYFGTQD